MSGQKLARGLLEPPPRPVAGDGVADLFAGGKARADGWARLGAQAGFDPHSPARGAGAVADIKKLRPFFQALDRRLGGRRQGARAGLRPKGACGP